MPHGDLPDPSLPRERPERDPNFRRRRADLPVLPEELQEQADRELEKYGLTREGILR